MLPYKLTKDSFVTSSIMSSFWLVNRRWYWGVGRLLSLKETLRCVSWASRNGQ